MKYLVFDTETTGLPKNFGAPVTDVDNWPRMVQLAWGQFDGAGIPLKEATHIIKPIGFEIPDDASKIHGITNEIAKQKGVDCRLALLEFAEVLRDSDTLIAHNIQFDEKIIGAEFHRAGIETNLQDIPKICTMRASTKYCDIRGKTGRVKFPKLEELYRKLFFMELDGAHDARVDTWACISCFFELKARGVI